MSSIEFLRSTGQIKLTEPDLQLSGSRQAEGYQGPAICKGCSSNLRPQRSNKSAKDQRTTSTNGKEESAQAEAPR